MPCGFCSVSCMFWVWLQLSDLFGFSRGGGSLTASQGSVSNPLRGELGVEDAGSFRVVSSKSYPCVTSWKRTAPSRVLNFRQVDSESGVDVGRPFSSTPGMRRLYLFLLLTVTVRLRGMQKFSHSGQTQLLDSRKWAVGSRQIWLWDPVMVFENHGFCYRFVLLASPACFRAGPFNLFNLLRLPGLACSCLLLPSDHVSAKTPNFHHGLDALPDPC